MVEDCGRKLPLLFALFVGFISISTQLDNGVALTPPMGWLSWSRYRCQINCTGFPKACINEDLYTSMADAMVSKGFRDAGYVFVNVDDCWSTTSRDAQGNQQADPVRFPHGIKYLADYMHERGLKFGLYSDIGNQTCNSGKYTGMGGHFEQDSKQFVAWGIDSLKVDGCRFPWATMNHSYPMLSNALAHAAREAGHPVLLVCSWPAYQIYKHAPVQFKLMKKYCNQWRNSYDIGNSFGSISAKIRNWGLGSRFNVPYDTFHSIAGPGAWNDPDQLLVGNGFLTPDESVTTMSMWCMWAAPLLMSNDVRNISQWETEILLNKEVIAVNQDPKGAQGYQVNVTAATWPLGVSLWRKELSDGSVAVAVYNSKAPNTKKPVTVQVAIRFEDVGFANITRVQVRDLWQHEDVGVFVNQFLVKELRGHATVMLKLSLAD